MAAGAQVRGPSSPPPAAPPGDAKAAARIVLLDRALAVMVILLAVLLASFPARNSDLWLHLATGRLLAEGDYTFGSNPFNHTAADGWWVNPSWAYDLAVYAIFHLLGGGALVAFKAVLAGTLALAMLRLGCTGPGLWVPAVCTALALVAIGPRLLLQPVLVSYLFLALTLWILQRPYRGGRAGEAISPRTYWPLLPLFVLWVNLDAWFLLGPLTVALYGLGQLLQQRSGAGQPPRPGEVRALGVALVLGVAVCLVNPHHVHAFLLPADLALSGAAAVLGSDPAFLSAGGSPLRLAFSQSGWGMTPAGLAYFALVLLGLASFAVQRGPWVRWRVLILGAFLLLSAYQIRNIPFFAVVAAPILALNFQEAAARRAARASNWPRNGRLLTLAAAVLLLAAAWPGWLQPGPFEPRRWAVEPDPGLQRTAERLARWRDEGKLGPEMLGFNASPEAGNYLAWFCPQEKTFLDTRLNVSPQAAGDLLAIRQGLAGGDPGGAWRSLLRKHRISHVLLHYPEHSRGAVALSALLTEPQEWALLSLEGRTAVFGWRDPARRDPADPFAGLELDLSRLGYHPPRDQQAPRAWPGREPRPPRWWDPFVTPRPPRPVEREQAVVLLIHFETLRPEQVGRHQKAWVATLGADLFGALAGGTSLQALGGWGCFQLRALHTGPKFLRDLDDAPPELLWQAIRAARRGLQANPDDANAHLALGEAYLRLVRGTRERGLYARLPLLERTRRVQAVTALKHAVHLNADLSQAHLSLAEIYRSLGYLDLARDHWKELLALTRQEGPHLGEDQAGFSARLGAMEKELQSLETTVSEQEQLFERRKAGLRVFPQADLAYRCGLPGKALTVLLGAGEGTFGPDGALLELELLLETGGVKEVREWMGPHLREPLGPAVYERLKAQLAAATGDYDAADEHLAKLSEALAESAPTGEKPQPLRTAMGLALGLEILNGAALDRGVARQLQLELDRWGTLDRVRQLAATLREQADVTVIRGLLDLESGRADAAEQRFGEALALRARAPAGTGFDFASSAVAQHFLRRLQETRQKPPPGQ